MVECTSYVQFIGVGSSVLSAGACVAVSQLKHMGCTSIEDAVIGHLFIP